MGMNQVKRKHNKHVHNKNQTGFTLIELMIVVSIIGILASLAIPQFMNFVRVAKTSEAPVKLNEIYKAISSYYVTDFGAGIVAAGNQVNAGTQCIALASTWMHSGNHPAINKGQKVRINWRNSAKALGVDDSDPRYFSYHSSKYKATAAGQCNAKPNGSGRLYIIWATADLDGNGYGSWITKMTTFRQDIGVDSNGQTFHNTSLYSQTKGQ